MINPKNIKLTLESDEVANARNGQVLIQPSDNKLAYKDHTGGEHVITTDTNLVTSVNGEVGAVVLDPDDLDDSSTTNKFTDAAAISKLSGIETGAEVNNISDANATDLTDGGETTLHSHPGGGGTLKAAALGDSVTYGYPTGATPWTSFMNIPNRTFTNLGLSGANTKEVIEQQLLKAVGVFKFSFNRDYHPLAEQNAATLTVDNNTLGIKRNTTADARAYMIATDTGQGVTIRGNAFGDGTCSLSIENSLGATLYTGTTSTTPDPFNVSFTTENNDDKIYFVVKGGSSGFSAFVNELEIEITDKSNVATGELFSMSGLNDVAQAKAISTTQRGYDFIAEQARINGIVPVALAITPVIIGGTWTQDQVNTIAIHNNYLHYESKFAFFVDNQSLGDADGIMYTVFRHDDTHPNTAGLEEIAKNVTDLYYTAHNPNIPLSDAPTNAGKFEGVPLSGTLIDAAINDHVYTGKKREQLLTYSETLSNSKWIRTDYTLDETTGIASPLDNDYVGYVNNAGVSGKRIRRLSYEGSTQIGNTKVRAYIRGGGEQRYYLLYVNEPGQLTRSVWFDTQDGVVAKKTNVTTARITPCLNGFIVEADFTIVTTTAGTLHQHWTDAAGAYTSDGGAGGGIAGYVAGLQTQYATIADNLPYVKTTDAPVTSEQTFSLLHNVVEKWNMGLSQREDASGGRGSNTGWEQRQAGVDYFPEPAPKGASGTFTSVTVENGIVVSGT